MQQDQFKDLWNTERPMYEAWADFVLNRIDSSIKKHTGSEEGYNEIIKIRPISRVKTLTSMLNKAFIRKKNKYSNPYKEITDKVGVRFVVLLTSQLRILQDIVEEETCWTYSKDRVFNDWESVDPRIFDYQSIHYVVSALPGISHKGVEIKEGTTCEIQLRTLLQHAYAELTHDTTYKGIMSAPPEVHRTFAKSMALMEVTDNLLCDARSRYEESYSFINSWKLALDKAAEKHCLDLKFLDDRQITAELLHHLSPLLEQTTPEKFSCFLDDPRYAYIYERIQNRYESNLEFKQPFILLVYFLSKKFQDVLDKYWPFGLELLEIVYSDLGLSPSWPTT